MARRYEVDVENERAVSQLRTAAATIVLLGCFWAAMQHPNTIGWIVITLSLLGVAAWVVLVRRSRSVLSAPERYALTLDEAGLTLDEGDVHEAVRWPDLASLEVDEDRLVIVVRRRDGTTFDILPRYAGIGVHDLCREIEEERRVALPAAE